MHQLTVIICGALLGTAFYYLCIYLLKVEKNRTFVQENNYLHPNSICYIRTVLAWCGYIAYFFYGWQACGIIVFTFAAILDGVDGLVARQCNLITKKGESLDPLCDKLTYLPPLISFAYDGFLTIWLVWLFVALEFCGQFFARTLLEKFDLSVSANNFGKIKTIISFMLVILCALSDANPHWFNMNEEILVLCILLGCASVVFKFVNRSLYADIFSILNMISGVISIILAVCGHITFAVLTVVIGQLFHLLDGYAAKKFAITRFSDSLDHLADLISFVLCPLVIVSVRCGDIGILPAFVYLLCAAYHVTTHNSHNTSTAVFTGLSPAAGTMSILGACLALNTTGIVILTMLVSILLVSHIRLMYFGAMVRKKAPRPVLFVVSAAILVILAYVVKSQDAQSLGYSMILCTTIYFVCSFYLSRTYKNIEMA